MTLNLLLDSRSAIRLAVALVLTGAVLLVYARLLFGPLPGRKG